jgi:response regulator RpfG family c-di-GMP phosphodiesterase
MKGKTYTHGITFFVCAQMHADIKSVSDKLEVGVSDFLRKLVKDYLVANRTHTNVNLSELQEKGSEADRGLF